MYKNQLVHNPTRKSGYDKTRPRGSGDDCLFCDQKILEKYQIFETDNWVVRANAYPFVDWAILIIPKMHIEFVYETSEQEWLELNHLMEELSVKWSRYYLNEHPRTQQEQLLDEGEPSFNFYINNGIWSGQTQRHLHWHFIPRVLRRTTGMEEIEAFHKVNIKPEETAELFRKLFEGALPAPPQRGGRA